MGTNDITVAVAGATGRLGGHLVDVFSERGHRVVPISRSYGVDLVTGEGLDEALSGVDVVVDAATSPESDFELATAFFRASTRNLQAAASRAGVARIVGVSIIGTERFDDGYNGAKNEHERALRAGPVPAQIVRAAQFHEFVEQLLAWCTQGDQAGVPEMRTQLVAARSVAEAVADVVEAPFDGERLVSEVAGPREDSLVAATRLLAERQGSGVTVHAIGDSDAPEHVLWREGALLPGPGARLMGPTYEEWLDAMVPGGSVTAS